MNQENQDTINTTEEQTIQDNFDYSETFQLQLLAELSRNIVFSTNALPLLRAKYFTQNKFISIFIVLKDYVSRFGALPTTADNFLDHYADVSRDNHHIEKADDADIKGCVLEIFLKNPDGSWQFIYEPNVVRHQTNGFIKLAAMKDALWESSHILGDNKSDKYDRIAGLIMKASSVNAQNSQPSLFERLMAKMKIDMNRTSKLLGLDMNKFKKLAWHIDGLQPGIIHIGAETSMGKTAFAVNMGLDVLMSNPQVMLLYGSFDDNENIIMNRMLAVLSGLNLNQLQRPDPIQKVKLIEAYRTLMNLAKEGRLMIYDISVIKSFTALELAIRQHQRENLVVVIDGIYNLEIGDKSRGLREDNIERANKIKTIADTFRIPIICTGETRKRQGKKESYDSPTVDDLMETGKFSYNANLVLLLYPEFRERYDEDESPTIILKYAKNKFSHYRGSQHLIFHRAQSRMEELEDNNVSTLTPFALKR